MSKYTHIRVLVARSQRAVQDCSCDDVRPCDTIGEAKTFARYALTEAYREVNEFTEPMNYACIMAREAGRDVCVADYFRKGHVEPAHPVEAENEEASTPEPIAMETPPLLGGLIK